MKDYTQILPQILPRYALTIAHHEHLRTSENLVVKLVADNGQPYALRIRKIIGSYQEQMRSELIVLRDFKERTNVEVPAPVATRDGGLYGVIPFEGASYLYAVFHWVAGVHLGAHEITPHHMALMAHAVSQLHNFSSTYHPPEGFLRPVYGEEWFFGANTWSTNPDFASRIHPEAGAFLQTANEAVRARLRRYPKSPEVFGLIHYDLHVGNFLFQPNAANMIDFDECGFGYYLFDLAHILFEFIEHPHYAGFKDAAVKHYAKARGGTACSESDLDLFLALQGIAYLNWLYRLFWRDGHDDALPYWIPRIVQRLKSVMK